MSDPTEQFRAVISNAGLHPPSELIADGKLHRFASNGKRSDNAGWYVLHDDGIPAGAFGDWRTGASETWRADMGRRLSPQEEAQHRARLAAVRRVREAEEGKRKAQAREKAATIWQAARPAADDHDYLRAKGVKAHGLRVHDGALVVPMRDGAELHSLQFIAGDGAKKFLTGGRVSGCYFSIGKPDGVLCIAEGYAKAASIHEATGNAVAVTFNAGNLVAVARALRQKFAELRLIICADDDAKTEGNPGLIKARDAAQAVSGLLAVPKFGDNRPDGASDFNDMALLSGAAAVKRTIDAAQLTSSDVPGGLVVRLIGADTIEPRPIAWLWPGWLARGKLHVLAGAPGTGKTTIALHMAACISAGSPLPSSWKPPRGRVVIWSGEDDPADTLVPRLRAAGADLSRVHFVGPVEDCDSSRGFDPAHDVPALESALKDMADLALIVVDPLVSAVHGDSHKNAEVRRSLAPLVELASAKNAALIGITHYSKGTQGREPLERVSGSLAFGALARIVYGTVRQQAEGDDAARSLFVRVKSNIGPDGGGYAYTLASRVSGAMEASSVKWGDAVEGAARELLEEAEADPEDESQDATSWLRDLLADGPISVKEVRRHANDAGFAWRTMGRARQRAGVVSRRAGFGETTTWALGSPSVPSKPLGPLSGNGTIGAIGTNGEPSQAGTVEAFEV